MARSAVLVEKGLARQLRSVTGRELAAQERADAARERLAAQLREARAEGYSVAALSKAAGLSPKRVRVLLSE